MRKVIGLIILTSVLAITGCNATSKAVEDLKTGFQTNSTNTNPRIPTTNNQGRNKG